MTNKRFWWSVVAVWIAMQITDWLFHGMWMMPWYQQTAQLWRPEAEMRQWMWTMWVGNFVFSWAFVWIWTKGLSKDSPWWQAFRYSWGIILVSQINRWTQVWATQQYPWDIIWRWALIGVLQAMICAFVMTWTYKPELAWQTSAAKAH